MSRLKLAAPAQRFDAILRALGLKQLEFPLFYHSPVAIRFEIGGNEPGYRDRSAESERLTPNPAYVESALARSAAIYRELPAAPDILYIDGKAARNAEELLVPIRERARLPAPAQIAAEPSGGDGDCYLQVQMYWDLRAIAFQPERLLREIILADIGGWNGFASSVFSAGTGPFLYHLYDDRGLDVLGAARETLRPLYLRHHDWILDYDLENIGRLFAAADENAPMCENTSIKTESGELRGGAGTISPPHKSAQTAA